MNTRTFITIVITGMLIGTSSCSPKRPAAALAMIVTTPISCAGDIFKNENGHDFPLKIFWFPFTPVLGFVGGLLKGDNMEAKKVLNPCNT